MSLNLCHLKNVQASRSSDFSNSMLQKTCSNVLNIIVCFYKTMILPHCTFCKVFNCLSFLFWVEEILRPSTFLVIRIHFILEDILHSHVNQCFLAFPKNSNSRSTEPLSYFCLLNPMSFLDSSLILLH